MKLNEDLLWHYIGEETASAEKGEDHCSEKKDYEKAIAFREKRYVLGDILMKMGKSAEEGGFLVHVSNIRKAVDAMSDEELAELLATINTINKNTGKLQSCDGTACSIECPAYYDFTEHKGCRTLVKDYMLKEAE